MPGMDEIKLFSDHRGRLLILGTRRDGADVEWCALASGGQRDLQPFHGRYERPGDGNSAAQAERIAGEMAGSALEPAPSDLGLLTARLLGPPPEERRSPGCGLVWTLGDMTFRDDPRGVDDCLAAWTDALLFAPLGESSDKAGRERAETFRNAFRQVCGEATARLAQLGIRPGVANAIDARFGADAVDRFAVRNPCLAGLVVAGIPGVGKVAEGMPDSGGFLLGRAGQDDIALSAVLASQLALGRFPDGGCEEHAPAIRVLLSRLQGVCIPWTCAAGAILGARHVPVDWLPVDEREARAFGICALVAIALQDVTEGVLDPKVMLAASKGRWSDFRRRISDAETGSGLAEVAWDKDVVTWGRPLPPGIETIDEIATGIRDMALRFMRQVYDPFHALAGMPEMLGADFREAPEGRYRDDGWRILTEGKGLPAIVAASREWHGRRQAMDDAIRTLVDARSWPRPFPDFVATNGVVVAPILDAAGLAEEGVRLRHCVAGYAEACVARTAVVASVRPGGAIASGIGSTVEFSWSPDATGLAGWRPSVRQHRANLNGPPPQAERAAVAEALEWLRARRPREAGRSSPRRIAAVVVGWLRRGREEAQTEAWTARDRIAVVCGYDWTRPDQVLCAVRAWGPFLPRHARGSLAGFGMAVGIGGWPDETAAAAQTTAAGTDRVAAMARRFAAGIGRARPILGRGVSSTAAVG